MGTCVRSVIKYLYGVGFWYLATMRKLLRVALLGLGLLIVASVIAYFILDKDRPVGKTGPAAEALADRMLLAVNKAAWDTTAFVSIDFDGRQKHRWRQEVDSVEVVWKNYRVDLYTEDVSGRAFAHGEPMQGDAAAEILAKAWSHFCNDAFWVAAPFKVRDPGTERSLVTLEDGREALLVTYTSGGVTPGDAYLWHLDANGLPTSYQMWVSIIPIGGIEATWEGWKTLSTGAKVATRHKLGPVTLAVGVTE